jgi:hypothetical protein
MIDVLILCPSSVNPADVVDFIARPRSSKRVADCAR